MKINKRDILTVIFGAIIGLSLTFGTGVVAQKEQAKSATSSFTLPIQDIQRFATVIAQIKKYYIKPVEDKTLFNNAIEGMLSELDPHSNFLDADDFKDLQTVTSGEFGGIGIEVMPQNGLIRVVSPLDGTPAYIAGVKAGDMIVRVDNKYVKDMSLRDAIKLIRGKIGSKVKLTIVRKGEKAPLVFELTRSEIKIHTVKSKMLESGYGYIRISFFQAPTKKDLSIAISKLKAEANGHLKGIILDLRNNPGGLLDSAIDVSDTFLDVNKLHKHDKLIVYTKGRISGSNVKAKATAGDMLAGTPIVVLINSGSASASEIVAGALQDHKRAVVVGTKSFGKGSVQTVIPVDYKTAIKLTTALYYTPGGRSIQATGIKPDVTVAELKVAKHENSMMSLTKLKEADLEGHIENADENKAGQKSKIEKSLAHSDYQLYEALNLLKGLHTLKKFSH